MEQALLLSTRAGRLEVAMDATKGPMHDLAYAAGAIDCDGTICYTGRNPSAVVALGITNPAIPEWSRRRFGGAVYKQPAGKGIRAAHPNWKGLHTWMINGLQAVEFLKQIQPFLLQKQEQADLVIKVSEATARTKGNWRLTPAMRALRQETKARINTLNKRGVA